MPSFWKGKFLGVNFMCGHFCVQEFCSWRSKKTHGWEHHVQPFVWLLVEKKNTQKKKNSPLKTPKYLYPVIACFSVAITWPKPWVSSSKKMTTTLGALASKVSEMPCKTGGIHAKFTRIHPSMVQVVSQLFSGGFWMVFLHPLEKCEKQSAETVWWFPKTGRPPIIIHLWMDFPWNQLINNHPFTDPFFDIHHKPSIIDLLMDKPAINHPFIDGFSISFHGRKSTEKLATALAECPPTWVNARGARRDRYERPPGFSHRERWTSHGKIMGKIVV